MLALDSSPGDVADAHLLPYHEKSDLEKDHLYKKIATQLDKIANDIETTHGTQFKNGQL